MVNSTDIKDHLNALRKHHGDQFVLNLLREYNGGVSDNIRLKQLDFVVKTSLPFFDLSYDQGMIQKKQYDGRRVIFIASIAKTLTEKFYWSFIEVSRRTKKADPNIHRCIRELKGLYPIHSTTKHLVHMHEMAFSACSAGQII